MINYGETFHDWHTALNASCNKVNHKPKTLRLETKNTQKNVNQRLGFIKSHHIQQSSLPGCSSPLSSALAVFDFHSNITKTSLFKYIENFTTKKWKFSDKNFDIFHISAQNIDCGYSLEPPQRGGSNEYPQSMFLSRNKKIMYTPVNPSFTI